MDLSDNIENAAEWNNYDRPILQELKNGSGVYRTTDQKRNYLGDFSKQELAIKKHIPENLINKSPFRVYEPASKCSNNSIPSRNLPEVVRENLTSLWHKQSRNLVINSNYRNPIEVDLLLLERQLEGIKTRLAAERKAYDDAKMHLACAAQSYKEATTAIEAEAAETQMYLSEIHQQALGLVKHQMETEITFASSSDKNNEFVEALSANAANRIVNIYEGAVTDLENRLITAKAAVKKNTNYIENCAKTHKVTMREILASYVAKTQQEAQKLRPVIINYQNTHLMWEEQKTAAELEEKKAQSLLTKLETAKRNNEVARSLIRTTQKFNEALENNIKTIAQETEALREKIKKGEIETGEAKIRVAEDIKFQASSFYNQYDLISLATFLTRGRSLLAQALKFDINSSNMLISRRRVCENFMQDLKNAGYDVMTAINEQNSLVLEHKKTVQTMVNEKYGTPNFINCKTSALRNAKALETDILNNLQNLIKKNSK